MKNKYSVIAISACIAVLAGCGQNTSSSVREQTEIGASVEEQSTEIFEEEEDAEAGRTSEMASAESSSENLNTAESDSTQEIELSDSAESCRSYLEELIEMGQLPEYEGLSIVYTGISEELFGETCEYFQIGTSHDENFVAEHHVYVAVSGVIYEYDVITDSYIGIDIPGRISSDGWSSNVLAAIITDPYSEEAMWYYAAQPQEEHMAIVAMQEGVSIRLEKVHVDWDTYETVADEVIEQEDDMPRGAAVYWEVPMSETIPEHRIVVEYNGIEAEWDACYDGENGDMIQYVKW